MILLADESVDRQIVARLRQEGHEVLYVAEMEPGITDDAVLALANQNAALLLTADKDFGELVFREGQLTTDGVVLSRLAGLSADRKADTVAAAFREHAAEFLHGFSVIEPGRIRVRRKP